MNPPNFSYSNVNEDPKNFVKDIQQVFELIYVVGAQRVN